MARFAAPWDSTLRVTTSLVVLILLVVVAAVALAARATGGPGAAIALAVIVFIAALVVAVRSLAPRGFAVEGAAIVVERRLRPVVIPLAAVRSVGPLPKGALRGALRLGGTGGFFGHFGRFWSRRLGAFRLYATRADGLVRIVTRSEQFVLSPEPPDRFIDDVIARAPHARRTESGDVSFERHPIPRRVWVGIAAIVALVPALVAAIFGASWAFAPRDVRVGAGAVVIERHWVGPIEIPLEEVRSASPLPPGAFRGICRVAGTAGFGHIAYGRFRSDMLGSFRMYAWRPGPYVLLHTASGPIVVTPDDPDRFLHEVRGRLRPAPDAH